MTNYKSIYSPGRKKLLRTAVAAVVSSTAMAAYAPQAFAADAGAAAPQTTAERAAAEQLEEVVVTGSRIVRRDLETNSPLLTIDIQQFEDNTFISVEEALNDLPQFMAGGATMGASTVTSLQDANGLDGGRGSGDMFNQSVLPDNIRGVGVVVPGAANVNLRGLGANRALTLIDGHRAMPTNASMTVDLNTIPSIAIGGMEVITGGASAVYGADALAGVTNIKFRDNFEGLTIRTKGGINEVGDGEEYQISTLMGSDAASGRAHVLFGMEYSKREESLWAERDFFREVMESPYSGSGNYLFGADPAYTAGAATGSFNTLQKVWHGNPPSTAAILSVFNDRTCRDAAGALVNCIANATGAPNGGGWYVNPDGTIYTRSSVVGTGTDSIYYGPQGFNQPASGTAANPREITCAFVNPTTSGKAATNSAVFAGEPCNPTVNTVDTGRWLSSPRDAYNVFGRGTFEFTDSLQAFANFHFAESHTTTRREPTPFLGASTVIIPFGSTQGGSAPYLPSVILTPAPGQVSGQTKPEYLAGGIRGTSCAPTGGCTMAQAFPVSPELRTLLESRPTSVIPSTGLNANNPFRGLNACQDYILANHLPAGTAGVQTNPNGGARYMLNIDPNTGQPLSKCGPNSNWQLSQLPLYLGIKGTENSGQLFQIAYGLRGDLGIKDWTWELYGSNGESNTQINYTDYTSLNTYMRILSAPNYGKGYKEQGPSSKFIACTSGLNPFDPNLVPTEDCLDAIRSNQIDRSAMKQTVWELGSQGGVMNLPAGEMRGALGAAYRSNSFVHRPDSLREADYVGDTSPGAFAAGAIDESVDVREVYGELLIPLLSDITLINSLELELGARYSDYSTGQEVDTYKIMGSWEPVEWLRVRGGYNRAERAPNMSELFSTPSGSAQFSSAGSDPCRNNVALANTFAGPTPGTTLNNSDTTDPAIRAKVQALCGELINQWGGNNASEFHSNTALWDIAGGASLVVGNPELRNEQGDTWTLGFAFTSPFEHALLSGISGTIDWYKAEVTDPVESLQSSLIVASCFNINGLNPNYSANDPKGFCKYIERDPVTGGIVRFFNPFINQGKLEIAGVDASIRWSAEMADLGLESVPGGFSISTNFNYLIDQVQRYGADEIADYAGYGGASEFRVNTGFTYSLDRHRVTLTHTFRSETDSPTSFALTPNAEGSTAPALQRNATQYGYDAANIFNLTGSTSFGEQLSASISVSNLFDTKPSPGGYDIRDPRQGFGNFSPFDDLVGRRYSFNLQMDF